MLLSVIEAYEDEHWMFRGEYWRPSLPKLKHDFKEPATLFEAIRFADKKNMQVNLHNPPELPVNELVKIAESMRA